MQAPYFGWVSPMYDAATSVFYWTTTQGCNANWMRAPGDASTKTPYRIEWTGGCERGWLSGKGVFTMTLEAGVSYVLAPAEYNNGFLTGTMYRIGYDAQTGQPQVWVNYYRSGQTTGPASVVSIDQAPAELRGSFAAAMNRFNSRAQAQLASVVKPPSYQGARPPTYYTDGYYYWSSSNGCFISRDNAPSPARIALAVRLEWSGACPTGWAEGKGELRWLVDGQVTSTEAGTFVAGKLHSGTGFWVASPADASEPPYVLQDEHQDGKITKRTRTQKYPSELRAYYQSRKRQYAAAHPKAKFEWFTPEEKQAMGKFFNDVVVAAQNVTEEKAAQARLDRATANYEAAIKAHQPERADLSEKLNAQMALTAVRKRNANSKYFDNLNASIRDARRTSGSDAPRADTCLSVVSEDLSRDEREIYGDTKSARLRYINQCRDVQIAVMLCLYEPSGQTATPGHCDESPMSYINPGAIWGETFDPTTAHNGSYGSQVFCPRGSHPTNFEAFEDTKKHGRGNFECVWN